MDQTTSGGSAGPAPFRLAVARSALELFAEQGFDATSVEQIAAAAGISRSTFFRQFGSKEDVVFADHTALLDQARELLARPHDDPWLAVCEAAGLVFDHFAAEGGLAGLRYAVVNAHPALRDKELVTVFRYEKLFEAHLRYTLPALDPLETVRFAAAVIATHNYLLREFSRGARPVTRAQMRDALDDVRRLFGVFGGPAEPSRDGPEEAPPGLPGEPARGGAREPAHHGGRATGLGGAGSSPGRAPSVAGAPGAANDVVVAVFPRSAPRSEVMAAVQRMLDASP